MTRITTSTSTGLDLNPALYTSPIVIDRGVTISNPFYPAAVYSDPSYPAAFAILNRGVIAGGTAGIGIDLAAGGSVTNGKAGVIAGYVGIEMSGGYGKVLNRGEIVGSHAAGTFRYGQIGVDLQAGGLVTNAARALISSLSVGVDIFGGAASVINYGTITSAGGSSNNGPNSIGIDLQSGGYVGNGIGGVISGQSDGIEIGDGHDLHGGNGTGGYGTVINYGTIDGGEAGVSLGGGLVFNAAGASVIGGESGVSIGDGTVINYGSISSSANPSSGVGMGARGLIINAAGGSINASAAGAAGVGLYAPATLINSGSVNGGRAGVGIATFFYGTFGLPGAVATNMVGGEIAGAIGVGIADGGTVINAGTIVGNSGTAVYGYGAYGSDRLVLYPSFAFGGLVVGDKYTSNTLELASAASVGTVTGLGSEIVHFGSIVFDAGAQWSVSGIARAFDGPITGFAAGDSLDLTGLAANSYTYSGGKLTLLENGKPVQSITISTPYSASHFYVNPDGGGTLLTVAPAAGANSFTFNDVSPTPAMGNNMPGYSPGNTGTIASTYSVHPLLAATNPVPSASYALSASNPHAGLLASK